MSQAGINRVWRSCGTSGEFDGSLPQDSTIRLHWEYGGKPCMLRPGQIPAGLRSVSKMESSWDLGGTYRLDQTGVNFFNILADHNCRSNSVES